eukprot:TRINITY_DN4893_c0_g1_i1.p2 TRINITY_DN4893_c0_g1~~TRINITY_DN4893_c0_g1_i1.p2  ORF type:complete len:65 (+),score=10.36 TRINITY_DN4893_c0_g1_i1:62-256(+)
MHQINQKKHKKRHEEFRKPPPKRRKPNEHYEEEKLPANSDSYFSTSQTTSLYDSRPTRSTYSPP